MFSVAEAAVREVLALVGGRAGDDVRLHARVAEAHAMLAELAALGGDPEGAAQLFARASAEFVAAGLPWFVVEYGPGSRRRRCGRPWGFGCQQFGVLSWMVLTAVGAYGVG